MDCGNQTRVFTKATKCTLLLSYPSNLKTIILLKDIQRFEERDLPTNIFHPPYHQLAPKDSIYFPLLLQINQNNTQNGWRGIPNPYCFLKPFLKSLVHNSASHNMYTRCIHSSLCIIDTHKTQLCTLYCLCSAIIHWSWTA